MMSSSPVISVPAHPQAAKHQPAAVDDRHPRLEPVADEKVTDQSECSDSDTDDDIGTAKPQSEHGVEQHEVDRPERPDLARGEMAEPAAEHAECQDQQVGREHPHIEGADLRLRVAVGAERERTDDAYRLEGEPDIAARARPQE